MKSYRLIILISIIIYSIEGQCHPISEEEFIKYKKSWEMIDDGGFGLIYKTIERGAEIVIKEPKIKTKIQMEVFINEVNNLKLFNEFDDEKENVVRFIDCYSTESGLKNFLRLEKLGISFDSGWFRRELKQLNLSQKLNIFINLTKKVKFIHELNRVHCDLKPGNIVLTEDNNDFKLVDFGFTMNAANNSCQGGSIGFTPPEAKQLKIYGSGDNKKFDIFSLGSILGYILFDGNDVPNKFIQASKSQPINNDSAITYYLKRIDGMFKDARITLQENMIYFERMEMALKEIVRRMMSDSVIERPNINLLYSVMNEIKELFDFLFDDKEGKRNPRTPYIISQILKRKSSLKQKLVSTNNQARKSMKNMPKYKNLQKEFLLGDDFGFLPNIYDPISAKLTNKPFDRYYLRSLNTNIPIKRYNYFII